LIQKGEKITEKLTTGPAAREGRTDGGNRPNRRNVKKALAAGASTYAPRREMGNALALAKLCGPQSVMSTPFALHSLPAQRHDANPPVTPPRHAVAG
jgi:hypothetical protein